MVMKTLERSDSGSVSVGRCSVQLVIWPGIATSFTMLSLLYLYN